MLTENSRHRSFMSITNKTTAFSNINLLQCVKVVKLESDIIALLLKEHKKFILIGHKLTASLDA